jgi:hypothetical protein
VSINLGPAAYEAITSLKGNTDWRQFVHALNEQMSAFMHRAVEVPPADREDATGYARAIRDIAAHIQLVENPTANRNPKPPVKPKSDA